MRIVAHDALGLRMMLHRIDAGYLCPRTFLVGMLVYPEARSFISTVGLSIGTLFNSQLAFLTKATGAGRNGRKPGLFLRKGLVFVIPVIIIFVFFMIYCSSNPVFDQLAIKAGNKISDIWTLLFKDLDVMILVTFMVGLVLSNYIFLRTSNTRIISYDQQSAEGMTRIKHRTISGKLRPKGILNEYRSGVFLLLVLNVIILVLNVIDIYWVWFNFEWNGQYLKQFVHEGTYLLLLSILISVALVLYYFRGNLNFFSGNRLLKYLSFAWIAQNAILALSVAIRNFWYIHYFSLAYKRIGVFIFLVLTLYGLFTVFLKVRNRKSPFYLLRNNVYMAYVVLVICSLINWDGVIASYNFNHADRSFLHLDYMSTLSDKTLPILDKPLAELSRIDKFQKEKFPFEVKYMTPEEYKRIIDARKKDFIENWEKKGFLSWNLPEYLAYRDLLKKYHL